MATTGTALETRRVDRGLRHRPVVARTRRRPHAARGPARELPHGGGGARLHRRPGPRPVARPVLPPGRPARRAARVPRVRPVTGWEQYRDVIEDREFPTVREWRERTGGKAIGCFPGYAPVELPYALGMLPVGIFGGGNRIELAHADSRFQSFICSIVKSTLELGFIGKLDLFDGLLFHSICDPARNLASVMERNFAERPAIY